MRVRTENQYNEEWKDRMKRLVSAVVLKYPGFDGDDRDTILGEVSLRHYLNRETIPPNSLEEAGWVSTTARRLVFSEMRRRCVRRRTEGMVVERYYQGGQAERDLTTRAKRHIYKAALTVADELGERDLAILKGVFQDDRQQNEMAEMLGMSPSGVCRAVKRILRVVFGGLADLEKADLDLQQAWAEAYPDVQLEDDERI